MTSQTMTSAHLESLSSLSISQLLRHHCRERLVVDPLRWTDRHLELLKIFFEDATPTPPLIAQPTFIIKNKGINTVRQLSEAWGAGARKGALRRLLTSSGSPLISLDKLYFHFNDYHVRTLPCIAFYLSDDYESARIGRVPPIVAYIHRDELEQSRMRSLSSTHPNQRYSRPTNAIAQLKLKRITPSNRLRDPYIAALLIGVAQRQRKAQKMAEGGESISISIFSAKVMYTDQYDEEHFHFFSAEIPSSFLHSLDNPTTQPAHLASGSPRIPIRHTTIPYKPHNTFRNRLLPLMLPDIDTVMFNPDEHDQETLSHNK